MAKFVPVTTISSIVLLVCVLVNVSVAQNCGCASNECCSQWGYCGTTSDYCGAGCQSGPCTTTDTNGVVVSEIVTEGFFNGIIDQADSSCEGKNFYSRKLFLDAAEGYAEFARVGSIDDSKREIAAFFAQVTHETGRK